MFRSIVLVFPTNQSSDACHFVKVKRQSVYRDRAFRGVVIRIYD